MFHDSVLKVRYAVCLKKLVVGWAIKSGVATGVTKSVGEALIHYFNDCSELPE